MLETNHCSNSFICSGFISLFTFLFFVTLNVEKTEYFVFIESGGLAEQIPGGTGCMLKDKSLQSFLHLSCFHFTLVTFPFLLFFFYFIQCRQKTPSFPESKGWSSRDQKTSQMLALRFCQYETPTTDFAASSLCCDTRIQCKARTSYCGHCDTHVYSAKRAHLTVDTVTHVYSVKRTSLSVDTVTHTYTV